MVISKKQEIIKQRAIKHGLLFIKRNSTIRSVAKETGFSKSIVHLDLHRLKEIHPDLYNEVVNKMNFNFSVKHIRGGNTMKMKKKKG